MKRYFTGYTLTLGPEGLQLSDLLPCRGRFRVPYTFTYSTSTFPFGPHYPLLFIFESILLRSTIKFGHTSIFLEVTSIYVPFYIFGHNDVRTQR